MRTSRIPASGAFVTGFVTPALVGEDGGSSGDALCPRWMAADTAKSRVAEVCYEVRGAKVGLQNDPVTAVVAKTGGASR